MSPHAENQYEESLRLLTYDYSQPGAYFVTICTYEHIPMFGEIIDDEMHLNVVGEIARDTWKTIPDRFPGIELDHFVIMPNHMHGIVVITDESKAYGSKGRKPLFGNIIRTYKAATTYSIRRAGTPKFCWQSNYYEHIIRLNYKKDLERIRQYIENNPSRWSEDEWHS